MTLQELANHWEVSPKEAAEIVEFMNKRYSLEVRPVSKNTWKWVLYAYDPRNKYLLMEPKQLFSTTADAIRTAQGMKMTPGQAKLMGVPMDAWLALTPKIKSAPKTNAKLRFNKGPKTI